MTFCLQEETRISFQAWADLIWASWLCAHKHVSFCYAPSLQVKAESRDINLWSFCWKADLGCRRWATRCLSFSVTPKLTSWSAHCSVWGKWCLTLSKCPHLPQTRSVWGHSYHMADPLKAFRQGLDPWLIVIFFRQHLQHQLVLAYPISRFAVFSFLYLEFCVWHCNEYFRFSHITEAKLKTRFLLWVVSPTNCGQKLHFQLVNIHEYTSLCWTLHVCYRSRWNLTVTFSLTQGLSS